MDMAGKPYPASGRERRKKKRNTGMNKATDPETHGTDSILLPSSPSPAPRSQQQNAIDADAALALTLAQEEFKDLQLHRDRLLAYSIANGTAKDEDIDLAYHLSRDTDELLASTRAQQAALQASLRTSDTTTGSLSTGFTPARPTDSRTVTSSWLSSSSSLSEGLMDWQPETTTPATATVTKQKKSTTNITNDDLLDLIPEIAERVQQARSLAEAQRLQEKYERETREQDEAWEAYRAANIKACIVCDEEQHRDQMAWPCEHAYCADCFAAGVGNALASHAPFRCCGKVLRAQDGCEDFLDADLATRYENLVLELGTPNPVYCHVPACAQFIPPGNIVADAATCTSCRAVTCRHCKAVAHPGRFCAQDEATEAVRKLGRAKGWKTCPGCNHLIERETGCLHMVCSRCQTAFCYRCSKRWNDCESTCPDREFPISLAVTGLLLLLLLMMMMLLMLRAVWLAYW